MQRIDDLCEKIVHKQKNKKKISKVREIIVLFRRDPAAGAAGAAAGTKTCLDNTLISRRVARARTQRKHKHETRLPGWGSQAN